MPFHLWPETGPETAPASTPMGVSRRGFLAGAAALALGGLARADAAAAEPWFALLSDTHIPTNPGQINLGQNPTDNLRRALDDVLGRPTPPAGLFVNGDLALMKGEVGDYRAFLGLIEPARAAKVPVHLALGNHDNREHVHEVVSGLLPPAPASAPSDRLVSVVDGPGLKFLLLDSLVATNSTPGRLGPAQLDWLAAALDAAPDTPAMVFVHHNPASTGTALLDTEALLAVLRPRRQAKALVFGHTHVWDYRNVDGLYLINLPAVAYAFTPGQPVGWCLFRPRPDGGTLQLRCHGGDRRSDRLTVDLTWRS